MKPSMLDMMRVWAAVTGLVLVVSYFTALYLEMEPSQLVPMLVAAIGGFELFLYAQDFWLSRRRRNG